MAVILDAIGVKEVHVLDCKFNELPEYKKATKAHPEEPKAAGKDFDFDQAGLTKIMATEADVQKVLDGKSTDQLVDTQVSKDFSTKGSFAKAKNVPRVEWWDSNHHVIKEETLHASLKTKTVDMKKPMIFVNGGPKNVTVQAVCRHYGIKDTKWTDFTYAEWKVKDEERKKKEADAKAAGDKKPDETPADKKTGGDNTTSPAP